MFKIIVLFVLYCASVAFPQREFSIGAIFKDSNDDNELAFRAIVDRINMHERSVILVPIITFADVDDSFLVEKAVCELISQGVIAIFGPSSSSTGIVSSICNTLEIPHILYEWIPEVPPKERQWNSMTLNVYPDNMKLANAYADIISSFSWKNYVLIYESEKELQEMQDVLQIHSPGVNAIVVRQLDGDPDFMPFLKDLKTMGESCFILHCSSEKIIPILRQANELKMLGEYNSFFLAPLDTHSLDFSELQHMEANVTTVRIIDPTNFDSKNVAYTIDQYAKRYGRILSHSPDKIQTHLLLMNDAVWAFVKGLGEMDMLENLTPPRVDCNRNRVWPFGKQIMEHIKGKSEEGATDRLEFDENGQRIHFTARVLELSTNSFHDIAVWDPVNGFSKVALDAQMSKKVEEKIQNKTFVISSRLGEPFLRLRDTKDGEIFEGNARYEGYSMDLIDSIAKLLGFKYRFELTPDNGYGSYDANLKKWNGIVGQLLDGKADLGICDLTMTSARRKVVDFTPPFMTLGISILFAKPETKPPNLFSFLSPFSLDVWIYMATAYLGVSLLLYAVARMAPDEWENPHFCNPNPEELENVWTSANTTWLSWGSLLGAGCDILPKSASTRLITGMWWFFALMMLNSYTANLAAFLTNSRMESSIESVEDLAKQSKIKYGVLKDGSSMEFFRTSNFSTYQKMWSVMESTRPSVFTKDNKEGVERILKSKRQYAFFMESTTLEYEVERKCELTQIGGWLDYKTYGIAMPFNSRYRKQISHAVLKLGESGTIAELKRRWWKERLGGGNCSKITKVSSSTLDLELEDVGGVFLVLGVGVSIGIIIGICEFIWNIRQIAIEEKITPKEALKAEVLFAIKFWVTTKQVRISNPSESVSKRSSKSNLETRSTKTTNTININGNLIDYRDSEKGIKSGKMIGNNISK